MKRPTREGLSGILGSIRCMIGLHQWVKLPNGSRFCRCGAVDLRKTQPRVVVVGPVKASSFADPADIRAFMKAKARGLPDKEAFKYGDNGIGYWGHDTAQYHTPMCALPREVWGQAKKKGGAKVLVTYKGKTVAGILGDTMPSLLNIKNGAGIDLNPAFAKAFGLKPPFLVSGVTWRWDD